MILIIILALLFAISYIYNFYTFIHFIHFNYYRNKFYVIYKFIFESHINIYTTHNLTFIVQIKSFHYTQVWNWCHTIFTSCKSKLKIKYQKLSEPNVSLFITQPKIYIHQSFYFSTCQKIYYYEIRYISLKNSNKSFI